MKCLKKNVIFDFIKHELSKDMHAKVESHLVSCKRCRNTFEHVKQNLNIVTESLNLLSTQTLPHKQAVDTLSSKTKQKCNPIPFIRCPRKRIQVAFSVVISICLVILLFNNQIERSREEKLVAQIIASEEIFFSGQSDDNSQILTIYDSEKKELQLIHLCQDCVEPIVKTIKINDYLNGG